MARAGHTLATLENCSFAHWANNKGREMVTRTAVRKAGAGYHIVERVKKGGNWRTAAQEVLSLCLSTSTSDLICESASIMVSTCSMAWMTVV